MYRIVTEKRCEDFHNLNQVYGFLVGILQSYRQHHPTVKFFKRWYQARCRRGMGDETFTIENLAIRIEKLMPSLQQAPRCEK